MMEQGSGDAGLRQAALALHALAEGDRAWVLQQLDRTQCDLLEPLLAELSDLGIPGDAAVLEVIAPVPVQRDTLDHLDGPALAALTSLLRHEPPQLVAALLAARAWPWRGSLLAALGTAGAAAVEDCAGRVASAPALQAAVLQALQHRLDDCGTVILVPRHSLWQRLTQRSSRRSRS